jgi:hypothetical protein
MISVININSMVEELTILVNVAVVDDDLLIRTGTVRVIPLASVGICIVGLDEG